MDVSWGFLGVLLQDFTKIQNLISLNISVLQLKLCVFANLHLRNCFRSAIEASFIALTYSQLCVFAFCILQMRTCFRSAIETSFIALTYSQLYKCEPAYFAPHSTKNQGFSKSSLLYLSGQPVSAFITEQPAARAMASPAAVSHSIVGA